MPTLTNTTQQKQPDPRRQFASLPRQSRTRGRAASHCMFQKFCNKLACRSLLSVDIPESGRSPWSASSNPLLAPHSPSYLSRLTFPSCTHNMLIFLCENQALQLSTKHNRAASLHNTHDQHVSLSYLPAQMISHRALNVLVFASNL
jgi:hypothetical protein